MLWQEMLPPAQDLSHAGIQAEHMASIDQQHHHLAQQHALGHHDPSLLAAHHQAMEHLNLHALQHAQQLALPSEITLNQGPPEA